jgi:hypothetical protein
VRNQIVNIESKRSKSNALENIDGIVRNLKKPGLMLQRDLNSFRHNRDFFEGHRMSSQLDSEIEEMGKPFMNIEY